MARYIDAYKLEKDLPQSVPKHNAIINGNEYPVFLVDHILHKIRNYPTTDVVEVKHGEWLPVQYTYFGLKRYECSECKDDEYWQKRYLEHKEKYCPNCGAKMDGERKDT